MPAKNKYMLDAKYAQIPNGLDMMNYIRASASSQYQEYVPVATQDNIKEVGNPILKWDGIKNEFLEQLAARIGRVIITSRSYNNPLKRFKRGEMTLGESEEEIFVNIMKAEPYYRVDTLGMTDAEDMLSQRIPDVRAAFHRRKRQDKFTTTVENDDLRTAFISYQNVENLVSRIIEAVYTSDEFAEFLLMKNVFLEAGNRGALTAVTVADISASQDNAKQAAKVMRQTSRDLTFMKDTYNLSGVVTHTPISEQVVFILSSVEAAMDVDVLAYAFNQDRANFIAEPIVVDDFGGLEQEGVVAILCDREWLVVYDNYLSMTEVYNPARLYWNYFLHHWETLSYSPFKNAVAFTTQAPTITAVTISPTTATVSGPNGGTAQFTGLVEGTGLFNKKVIYTVTGTGTENLKISDTGLLTVPAGTTITTANVVATAAGDSTKSATAVVTIQQPA